MDRISSITYLDNHGAANAVMKRSKGEVVMRVFSLALQALSVLPLFRN
jgi:hypothetical protein